MWTRRCALRRTRQGYAVHSGCAHVKAPSRSSARQTAGALPTDRDPGVSEAPAPGSQRGTSSHSTRRAPAPAPPRGDKGVVVAPFPSKGAVRGQVVRPRGRGEGAGHDAEEAAGAGRGTEGRPSSGPGGVSQDGGGTPWWVVYRVLPLARAIQGMRRQQPRPGQRPAQGSASRDWPLPCAEVPAAA